MTSPPNEHEVDELMVQACTTAALASLASAGVLSSIVDSAMDVAQLARRHDLDPGALRRALAVARAMGVLERSGDEFRVSPALVARAETGPQPVAAFIDLLRMLPEHLRAGQALVGRDGDRAPLYRWVTPALARMWHPSAAKLADLLDHREVRSILDVGAGTGVWSIAQARLATDCEVTALDLDPVLAGFITNAKDHAIPHRTVAGDYQTVALDREYDRVLLANVLHLEPAAAAAQLVARASAWTRPGGEVVVIDVVLDDVTHALAKSVYALHLGLRIEGSCVHAAETIVRWGEDAGLRRRALHHLDERRSLGAIVMERPG